MTDMRTTKWKYFFPCGQWLAKDEGDGAICRDLAGSKDPFAMRKGEFSRYTGNMNRSCSAEYFSCERSKI